MHDFGRSYGGGDLMNEFDQLKLLSKPIDFHNWYYDYRNYEKCGCGADRARFDYVPDKVFLSASIKLACCIHDYRYEVGGTEEDKIFADRELMYNITVLVDEYSKAKWWFPGWLARYRAVTYYNGVVYGGKKSFNYHEEVTAV